MAQMNEILGAMIAAQEIYSGKILGISQSIVNQDAIVCVHLAEADFDGLDYPVTGIRHYDNGESVEYKQVGVVEFNTYRFADDKHEVA
jgi:hypothetical protein